MHVAFSVCGDHGTKGLTDAPARLIGSLETHFGHYQVIRLSAT